MRFVTSLSLQRTPLVVIVFEAVVDHVLERIAYGVDPSQDPSVAEFVFVRQVFDLGGFLKTVVDSGDVPLQLLSGDALVDPFSVDVPAKPPVTPWPQALAVVALAHRITGSNGLTDLFPATAA